MHCWGHVYAKITSLLGVMCLPNEYAVLDFLVEHNYFRVVQVIVYVSFFLEDICMYVGFFILMLVCGGATSKTSVKLSSHHHFLVQDNGHKMTNWGRWLETQRTNILKCNPLFCERNMVKGLHALGWIVDGHRMDINDRKVRLIILHFFY